MSFKVTESVGRVEEVEWLWPDRIMQNKFVLVDGRGESGKSSLVSKVIGDWHNNKDLPQKRKLKRVLWLTEEEEFDTEVKPRLMQYGLSSSQIITIDYMSGEVEKPTLPMQEKLFVDLLKEQQVNCVVLDDFTETLHDDWDIMNNKQMKAYINGLNRICVVNRTTMFGMRHMRKASSDHSSDDGMGCAKIRDTSRCVLRIDKSEELKPKHFLTVQKCGQAKPTKSMEFGFTTVEEGLSALNWIGEVSHTIDEIKKMSETKVKRSKLEEAKILLFQTLHDGDKPCKGIYEEGDENGIKERTIDEAKSQMKITSHRIVPVQGKPHSVWRLPEEHRSENYTFITGKEMPQLTLSDLPEAQPEQATNLPDAGTPKSKQSRKPKAAPKAAPEELPPIIQKKSKGKGGAGK